MIDALDHVVILIDDLDRSTTDYTALGFTVTPGGEHTGGATHNALIVFSDDSYLELIAFKRPAPSHRWWRHVHSGEGLIDFAVRSETITEDLERARARGASFEGPEAGGRQRPDGQWIRWQLAHPSTGDLPFVIEDVTPRSLRIPMGAARSHANGALGIAGLTVVVEDLDASIGRYRALLERGSDALPTPGAAAAVFEVGGAMVTLAGPGFGASAFAARLAARGEGPRILSLRMAKRAGAVMFDLARAHGVPIFPM